ncbi:MAG: ABC transporter permease [Bdellovibrionales bacterium]|nr:ABC transporter permease [Bdellovibrionales bacterium]
MNKARLSLLQTAVRIAMVFAFTWVIARSLLYFLPGDPAEYLAHETLVDIDPAVLRDRMELDQTWTHRVFSLPRSESLVTGKPIFPLVRDAFYNSVALTSLTIAFFLVLVTLVLLGSYRSSRMRAAADAISVVIASLPVFILGPIFLFVFSLKAGLFPVSHHPVLPALTLAIYLTGFWYRALSRRMERYLPISAISGAHARGVPENQAFFRYLLIPSLGGYFGFLGSQIGTLLNGSVLIEIIFQWNGLGSLLTDAVLSRDYPLVESTLLTITLVTLFCLQLGYWAQDAWEEKLS